MIPVKVLGGEDYMIDMTAAAASAGVPSIIYYLMGLAGLTLILYFWFKDGKISYNLY